MGKRGPIYVITDTEAEVVQLKDGRKVPSFASRPTVERYEVVGMGPRAKNCKVGEYVLAPKTSCARPIWLCVDNMYVFRCHYSGIIATIGKDVPFRSSWEVEKDYEAKKLHQEDLIRRKKFSAWNTVSTIGPYGI